MQDKERWQRGAYWTEIHDDDGKLTGLDSIMSANLREAASWRLGAELVRRYPEDLAILLSWPIGGVSYDCLRVVRLDGKGFIDINRNASGSASRLIAGMQEDGWTAMLTEWLSIPDRKGMIQGISEWMGMPAISKVPPTTKRTLTYRAIAAFLAEHAFDKESWRIEGVMRIDDIGAPVLLGELIDAAGLVDVEAPAISHPREIPDSDAACMFLFLRDEDPIATVFTDASVMTRSDLSLDLMGTYEIDHNVGAVAASITQLLLAEDRLIDPSTYSGTGLQAPAVEKPAAESETGTLVHHWIMPATARLTAEEAEAFANLVEGGADTPLGLMPGEVRCARCDETPQTAVAGSCPGFTQGQSFPHRWAGLLKLALSEDEAQAWSKEATFPSRLRPQGVGLVCVSCGTEWSQAQPECPEQRLLFGFDYPAS